MAILYRNVRFVLFVKTSILNLTLKRDINLENLTTKISFLFPTEWKIPLSVHDRSTTYMEVPPKTLSQLSCPLALFAKGNTHCMSSINEQVENDPAVDHS